MTFKNTFCPSPWFHMRINNSGTYEYCRWMRKVGIKDGVTRAGQHNIRNESPLEYFQNGMAPLRKEFLDGGFPTACMECEQMEQHGKASGRQRQLLKVGIQEQYFEKSLASSTLKSDFDYSWANQGHTLRSPTDWQIDLGNYCNGRCVFCGPDGSSRLATEFKQLGIIKEVPPLAWCDDPVLLNRFTEDLKSSANIQYLHFIGGEPVIIPGFQAILSALVEADLAKNITVGFTTNLNVWNDHVVELLAKFKQVNLGMSVETLTPVNDYVRYPSTVSRTQELLDRWRLIGREHGWLMQLRTTTSCLTVHDLTTVYSYAWEHSMSVESCNFLNDPMFMRIGVLPPEYRKLSQERLRKWIDDHPADTSQQIINTRDPNIARSQILQDAISYLNYLDNAEDESFRLPDLVAYLKKIESSRSNSILTYIPEYEELFRSAGY